MITVGPPRRSATVEDRRRTRRIEDGRSRGGKRTSSKAKGGSPREYLAKEARAEAEAEAAAAAAPNGPGAAGGGNAAVSPPQDDQERDPGSEWFGKGADLLGLSGPVGILEFDDLFTGCTPDGSGDPLVTDTDPLKRRVAGFEYTFSPPKSFSIVELVDQDLFDVHMDAVKATLKYAEKHFTKARIPMHGDRVPVNTGNLVAALYPHVASRELDPQLHIHAFVFGVTHTPSDNKWRALYRGHVTQTESGGKTVQAGDFYTRRTLLGQVYMNALAQGTRAAGYAIDVTDPEKGNWEIRGVPEKLTKAFSKRNTEVREAMEEYRERGDMSRASDSRLGDMAWMSTRMWKGKPPSKEALMAMWEESAKHLGSSLQEVSRKSRKEGKGQRRRNRAHTRDVENRVRESVEGLLKKGTAVSRDTALTAGLRACVGEAGLAEVEDTVNRVLETGKVVELPKSGKLVAAEQAGQVEDKAVSMSVKPVLEDVTKNKLERVFNRLGLRGLTSDAGEADVRQAVLAAYAEGSDVMGVHAVVTPGPMIEQINREVRERMVDRGDVDPGQQFRFRVFTPRYMTPSEKCEVSNYSEGDYISADRAGTGFRAHTFGSVWDVRPKAGQIVMRAGKARRATAEIWAIGDQFTLWDEKEIDLAVGDKVVFLKKEPGVYVDKDQVGKILSFGREGRIEVELRDGSRTSFSIEEYNFLDHGYAGSRRQDGREREPRCTAGRPRGGEG